MTIDHDHPGAAPAAPAPLPARPPLPALLPTLPPETPLRSALPQSALPPLALQPFALPPLALPPLALLAALLAGCGTPLLPQPASIVLPQPAMQAPPPATLMLPDETAPLLAYHQQVRRMTQGEMLQELAMLGPRQPAPKVALQTGMVLMWTRGAGDLARAQAQFDTVAYTTHPLAPLATLLSAQCQEQRRLAEHADKQQAQLKESQRRIDQLTETLESLKAIERNLPARGTSNERQR